MTMKRRGFLTMLGAAIGAPALPAIPSVGLGRSAFEVAVAHAQKFPVVSVGGLAKRGNLSMAQAEAMIKRLALEGKVKLVGPSKTGTVRAASRILTNDPWGIARTSQERPVKVQRKTAKRDTTFDHAEPSNVAPWLAHLHDLCRAQGMTLNHRCFT